MKPIYIAIAIFSSALMGLNVVVSKMGVQHFPPLLFSALRFATIIPFAFFVPRPRNVSFSVLMSVAMCWGVLYIGGINYALHLGVKAGLATILVQFSTFIGFLMSWLVFAKPPTFAQILGSVIGFFGICMICYVQDASGSLLGVFVLMGAAFSFAAGTITVKKCEIPALPLVVWVNIYSVIPMFVLSILFGEDVVFSLLNASIESWKTVLFAGWVSTLLGSFCWLYVVTKCELNAVMPFRFLVPVFGTIFAIAIFGETYPASTWVGAMLVLSGLAVTHIYPIIMTIKQKSEVGDVQKI